MKSIWRWLGVLVAHLLTILVLIGLVMMLGAGIGVGVKHAFAAQILQDPALTPGAVTDEPLSQMCQVGTEDERKKLSPTLKAQIFYRYGITNMSSDDCGYQLDHLIPNGIGGASNILNIWPQSLCGEWSAYKKDRLDRWARKEVCSGRLSIKDAQELFINDWTKSYLKAFGIK